MIEGDHGVRLGMKIRPGECERLSAATEWTNEKPGDRMDLISGSQKACVRRFTWERDAQCDVANEFMHVSRSAREVFGLPTSGHDGEDQTSDG